MLPTRLKIARKNKKLTQEELANKVKTTKGTISNYENGHSSPPNEMLTLLADELDVTTDWLLGREKEYLLTRSKKSPLLFDIKEQYSDNSSNQENTSDENLFFFNLDGLDEEGIEEIKKAIEFQRWRAKQRKNQRK